MARPDLSQLVTLDVLLSEGSVARAAKRLNLSPSAMSRALARLRETVGDPLLVRAGRGLVPTPRALELRERVGPVVREAEALLRPAERPDLASVERTFAVRTREGFVETFGPALLTRLATEAPGVRLRFVLKADRESTRLRDGGVDLETGVIGDETGPEVMSQALFRDRLVAVVRPDHPLAKGRLTPARYAEARHVGVARPGEARGRPDEALDALGLTRDLAVQVESFAAALALARSTDLVATVPERHTEGLREGLTAVPLPFDTPAFTVSMLWHPRLDADAVHRWLRARLREVCSAA